MIGSDRVQAIVGVDGPFPEFFGTFHPRLETPVRVNLLSGVVATVRCTDFGWDKAVKQAGILPQTRYTLLLFMATPLAAWHMFEQSGRLLVPNSRTHSWYRTSSRPGKRH